MKGTIKIKKYLFIILITIIIAVSAIVGVFIYTLKSDSTDKSVDGKVNSSNSNKKPSSGKFNIDNVVFLGDSITEGYVVYKKVPATNVIHLRGLAESEMFNQKMTYNNEKVDLEDILKKLKPDYLYIGFGMNDQKKSVEDFHDTYKQNIQKIMSISPDTKIVLVSITPINSDFSTNDKIDDFNISIKQIAEEIGKTKCGYINIHDELTDSKGKLNRNYDSGDGIHINQETYDVILDYIKNNPVF